MDLMNKLEQYVNRFNAQDEELPFGSVRNKDALDFLKTQIPRVELPDPDLERIYYFRWWTFRKHIRKTGECFTGLEGLFSERVRRCARL